MASRRKWKNRAEEFYRTGLRLAAAHRDADELAVIRSRWSTRHACSMAWTIRPPSPRGRLCLLARRMVERGVRFVQDLPAGGRWTPTRDGVEPLQGLLRHGSAGGRPGQGPGSGAACSTSIARSLRPSSGRTLDAGEGERSRPQPLWVFTMWMAGGGVRPGIVIGKTDEVAAVRDRGPPPRPATSTPRSCTRSVPTTPNSSIDTRVAPAALTANEGQVYHGLFRA